MTELFMTDLVPLAQRQTIADSSCWRPKCVVDTHTGSRHTQFNRNWRNEFLQKQSSTCTI